MCVPFLGFPSRKKNRQLLTAASTRPPTISFFAFFLFLDAHSFGSTGLVCTVQHSTNTHTHTHTTGAQFHAERSVRTRGIAVCSLQTLRLTRVRVVGLREKANEKDRDPLPILASAKTWRRGSSFKLRRHQSLFIHYINVISPYSISVQHIVLHTRRNCKILVVRRLNILQWMYRSSAEIFPQTQ